MRKGRAGGASVCLCCVCLCAWQGGAWGQSGVGNGVRTLFLHTGWKHSVATTLLHPLPPPDSLNHRPWACPLRCCWRPPYAWWGVL